jgi:methionyl-tRNA formyltransferase
MKIIIFAHNLVGLEVIKRLIDNHDATLNNILVFTYNLIENKALINFLNENEIAYSTDSISTSFAVKTALDFQPDIVISAYGRELIPNQILMAAKLGSFNMHPSLLPEYSGCFSGPWAIINGESKTGITFHEMTEKLDKGKILFQKDIPINKNETAISLYNKLSYEFIMEFDGFFDKFINKSLVAKNMPEGGVFYPRKIPFNGIIDHTWTNECIDSFIRAMFFPPFKCAVCVFDEIEIEIESMEKYTLLCNRFSN